MNQVYDVAVIGAGPSGIAAAVYSAKFGAKTVLIEKNTVIGGTALSAYVNTLNGESLSMMDGLLEGITKKAWGSTLFNSEELLDRYYSYLSKFPVEIKTGYCVTSAKTDADRVSSLLCSTAEGKILMQAKVVIDASGSFAINRLLGGEFSQSDYQYATGLIGKVEAVGGKCYSPEAKTLLSEKIAQAKEKSILDKTLGIYINPTIRADIAHITVKYESADDSGRTARKMLNSAIGFLQKFGYGFEDASLIVSSSKIFHQYYDGSNSLQSVELEDIEQNKRFSENIAAIPDGDGTGDRLYYIPYASLLSNEYSNLLLCGRNIGATANAMDKIDAITTHFETGKSAGIAAAIAIKNEIELSEVSSYEIMSKTEDSVSDKIEIMSEAMGVEDKEETFSSHSEPTDTEPIVKENVNPVSSFNKNVKAGENFEELDKVLGFLGDKIFSPETISAQEEIAQFTDSFDVEAKVPTAPAEAVVSEEPAATPKSDVEALFDTLSMYSDITSTVESEENNAKNIDEDLPTDSEVVAQENYSRSFTEQKIGSYKNLGAAGEDGEAGKSTSASNQSDTELTYETPMSIGSYQSLGEANTGKTQETASHEEAVEASDAEAKDEKALSAGENSAVSPYSQESESSKDEDKPVLDLSEADAEPEEIQAAQPEQPKKKTDYSIISNSDVLSLLYEDDEPKKEATEPKENSKEASIVQDELSLLYEEVYNNPEEKAKHKPKRKAEKKDKVDAMLDMIYGITDADEKSGEAEFNTEEYLKNKEKNENKQTGIDSDKLNKFKSIKDFLYDNDD